MLEPMGLRACGLWAQVGAVWYRIIIVIWPCSSPRSFKAEVRLCSPELETRNPEIFPGELGGGGRASVPLGAAGLTGLRG